MTPDQYVYLGEIDDIPDPHPITCLSANGNLFDRVVGLVVTTSVNKYFAFTAPHYRDGETVLFDPEISIKIDEALENYYEQNRRGRLTIAVTALPSQT